MPKEYTEVLKVLQDSAPPLTFEEISVVLNSDLPEFYKEVERIDPNAIAAASLAQVHKAWLKSGEEVAVKIQYPFLEAQTVGDFKVIKQLTKACNYLLRMYDYHDIDLLKLWATFSEMCIKETDFLFEMENAETTREHFKGDPKVSIPEFNKTLCCKRVLTMEFIKGTKITDIDALKAEGFCYHELTELIVKTFAKMIFETGHVHCDPHPGNILVRRGSDGQTQLILLDHGFYREMTLEFRLIFCDMWRALVKFDYPRVKELSDQLGIGEYYRYLPLVLTYRTIDSNKPLGQLLTKQEKYSLHAANEITFEKISRLLQLLPPEIMFIIRTSNLVAMHSLKLSGSLRRRFQIYTDFALWRLTGGGVWYWWEKLKFWLSLVWFEVGRKNEAVQLTALVAS
jgi:aarF domain-containing kinase